ncbi:MAG: MBL fold metallo-hydrolase [Acidisphaera sp.]|nr:MBL fold metallo-hydrolase [Acidisphaera sp.]
MRGRWPAASCIYPFRIGDLPACVVSDGPLALPPPADVWKSVPESALHADLAAAFLPADRTEVEQNALLLEAAGQTLLFDAGLGDAHPYGPHSGRLVRSLAEAGIEPDAIDAVILTHAHSDQCWGLTLADGTPRFPDARIYISQIEFDFWAGEPAGERLARSVAGFRRHVLPLRDRITFLRDGEEFLPGITALATPGHTPGHTSHRITSGDAALCLAADVVHHSLISFRHAAAAAIFDVDPAQAVRTRAALLSRLADERTEMLGYHLAWPGLGHVQRDGTAFRFLPTPMRLVGADDIMR